MRFPRSERHSFIIAALLTATLALVLLFRDNMQERKTAPQIPKEALRAFRNFRESIPSYGNRQYSGKEQSRRTLRLFPFDPNTADSATLSTLGLSRPAVRAIIHYRSAGGHFRRPGDLSRIYTLSASEYRRIRPYITIPASATEPHIRRTPLTRDFPVKLREGESVDLNSSDTAVLMRVPGVGRVTAARIIKYGRLLGGYTRATQIREVYGMAEGTERYFHVTTPSPVTIDVNKADYGALARHPYIGRKLAAEVIRLRRKYGRITSMSQLAFALGLGEEEKEKLLPYLSF
jgi:DNA uptake protein ComE-like DNA-binding protein